MITTLRPSRAYRPRGTTRSPGRAPLRVLTIASLVVAIGGCPSPDAEGKFDRFNEQTKDARDLPVFKLDLGPMDPVDTGAGSGGPWEPVCPDVDGVFLLALAASIAPEFPFQFIADVEADLDDQTGDGRIDVVFQPLSLDPQSTTEPREEVGEALQITAEVASCSFSVDLGRLMVTGAANPITGSDITATLSLDGVIRNEDLWCGNVRGELNSPIAGSLDGSTFAAVRLADRSERPVQFPASCAGVDAEEGS